MRIFSTFCFAIILLAQAAGAQTINTYAGGGPNNVPAVSANLALPNGVTADGSGNLFVAVRVQSRVFKVDGLGQLTVFAGVGIGGFSGDGGAATAASLNDPRSVAIDGAGNVFIADTNNHRIRRVAAGTGIITTIAGNGSVGFSGDGGPASGASLFAPTGVALDTAGNLFIADQANHRIRKVAAGTGVITTVAGFGSIGFSGDGGPATAAHLASPTGVAVDVSGNLFIADQSNQRIRKVAAGIITTVAGNGTAGFAGDGGPATTARLFAPVGVAFDSAGNMFISDANNRRIRRVTTSGIITTFAGTGAVGFGGDGGPATNASLDLNGDLTVDPADNLFLPDFSNHRIRRVAASTGIITTIAGNGTVGFGGDTSAATNASLNFPQDMAVDATGNLFIADRQNSRIRRVAAGSGVIATVAGNGNFGFSGNGGPATSASLHTPSGVALDGAGNLYIADNFNHMIRKVTPAGIISTFAGTGAAGFSGDGGPATSAVLRNPTGVALDAAGNLYMALFSDHRIRKVNASGIISTVAGTGVSGFSGDGGPAASAALASPAAVAVDAGGNLYIADQSNHRIRRVDASSGVITTVAGNGIAGFIGDGDPATATRLNGPTGVVIDAPGNIFIADQFNHRIRRVDAVSGNISTVAGNGVFGFAGDGGTPAAARLANPIGVEVDPAGNLFIADQSNHRVRRVVFQFPPNVAVAPAIGTYGGSVNLAATLSSGGSGVSGKLLSFSLFGLPAGTATTNGSGVATLSGVSLGATNVDTYPNAIKAAFAGDAGFLASDGGATLTVTSAPLTITANNKVRVYGAPDPVFDATYSGFVLGQGPGDLTGALSCTTSATASTPPGDYHISCTGQSSTNYSITYLDGTLTIPKADTITVVSSNNNPANQGQAVSFTATVSVVAPGTGTPTGAVTFKNGLTTLGTVLLGPSGQAVFTTSTLAVGTHSVTAEYGGNANFNGSPSSAIQQTINNVPPSVSISAPAEGSLYAAGSTVNLSAPFTDPGTADTHTCMVNWDDGVAPLAGTVDETSGSGTCTSSKTINQAGVYTLAVTVTDNHNASGTASVMIVVYDPSGGFVTGGGWINSPPGAYAADASLTGKANFGFVSKYQRGATTPIGETEFQFKIANLNFHSSTYEWLVVSGPKAQYKGSGTINGSGDYGFLLTATDGQVAGGGDVDKFRIKIWDKVTSTLVYDNVSAAGDDIDAANPQAISGGSIVIHNR